MSYEGKNHQVPTASVRYTVATAETLDTFLEAKIRRLIEQGCCQGWYAVGLPSTKESGSALTYFSATSRSRSQMPSGSGLQKSCGQTEGVPMAWIRSQIGCARGSSNWEGVRKIVGPQYFRGRQQSDSSC